MLILALESSAKAASAALVRDGGIVAVSTLNSGLTHSRTLLPMTNALLENTGIALDEVDLLAVAHGPGSFTGVRIGVSTIKGLAWAGEKPCVGVSTLEALAYNGLAAAEGEIICCAMDARRNQLYNALFEIREGRPQRLTPDRAIAIDELAAELAGRRVWVVGDGAALCHSGLADAGARLAPEHIRMQTAWGVAMAAATKTPGTAHDLIPVYLRLSQAERERQARLVNNREEG